MKLDTTVFLPVCQLVKDHHERKDHREIKAEVTTEVKKMCVTVNAGKSRITEYHHKTTEISVLQKQNLAYSKKLIQILCDGCPTAFLLLLSPSFLMWLHPFVGLWLKQDCERSQSKVKSFYTFQQCLAQRHLAFGRFPRNCCNRNNNK